jgi:hypothetical protein
LHHCFGTIVYNLFQKENGGHFEVIVRNGSAHFPAFRSAHDFPSTQEARPPTASWQSEPPAVAAAIHDWDEVRAGSDGETWQGFKADSMLLQESPTLRFPQFVAAEKRTTAVTIALSG